MGRRCLVLDANILIRAILGRRVRQLIEVYAVVVDFYVPLQMVYRVQFGGGLP